MGSERDGKDYNILFNENIVEKNKDEIDKLNLEMQNKLKGLNP